MTTLCFIRHEKNWGTGKTGWARKSIAALGLTVIVYLHIWVGWLLIRIWLRSDFSYECDRGQNWTFLMHTWLMHDVLINFTVPLQTASVDKIWIRSKCTNSEKKMKIKLYPAICPHLYPSCPNTTEQPVVSITTYKNICDSRDTLEIGFIRFGKSSAHTTHLWGAHSWRFWPWYWNLSCQLRTSADYRWPGVANNNKHFSLRTLTNLV